MEVALETKTKETSEKKTERKEMHAAARKKMEEIGLRRAINYFEREGRIDYSFKKAEIALAWLKEKEMNGTGPGEFRYMGGKDFSCKPCGYTNTIDKNRMREVNNGQVVSHVCHKCGAKGDLKKDK